MRIFLGSIISHFPRLPDVRVGNILETFYALRKPPLSPSMQRAITNPGYTVFLDSGAHSIITGNKDDIVSPEHFFRGYYSFIERYRDHLFCFVELDIEQKYGQAQVDEWFERLQVLDPDHNKLIRVWHPAHGWERWKMYCAQTNYVGIGGGWNTKGRVSVDRLVRMVRYAYERGVKVHAFGCASDTLKEVPFYSADAITWKHGWVSGGFVEYKNGGIKTTGGAKQYHGKPLEGDKLNPGVFMQGYDKYREGIKAMVDFENYLTELWRKRGVAWNE